MCKITTYLEGKTNTEYTCKIHYEGNIDNQDIFFNIRHPSTLIIV